MIMFFVTHGSEVRTESFIERAWLDGKKVAVPLVSHDRSAMSALEIRSLTEDLEHGAYGIREPRAGSCRIVHPADIDLVLVPALAFDLEGHRIGYGKGYYDAWLKGIPRQLRVGLAYDFQVIERVPRDGHDIPVGTIITEKRTIRTKTVREDAGISRTAAEARNDKP